MSQYTYDDDMTLRELVMIIWQGRWWIILSVLVTAAAASVYATYMRDPVYKASVSFLAPDYRLAEGRTLRQSDYLPLFRKVSIAEELVHRYGLASADMDSAISSLLASIDLRTESSSSVVVVSLQHEDRATALSMLRDYASLVRSEVMSFAAGIDEGYLRRVEDAFQACAAEYEAALGDRTKFEVTSNLSGLRASLQSGQARLASIEQRMDNLKSAVESLRTTLEEAQRQVAETQPLVLVKDVLDTADASLLAQRDLGNPDQTSTLAIQREQVNPVYANLLDLMYTSQRQLHASKAELAVIEEQKPALSKEVDSLRQRLAEAEERYAMLSTAINHAKTRYDEAASLRASVWSTVASINNEIMVVSGPWASNDPVGPGRLRIVALAVVLAEFVSVLGVVFGEYMRSGRQRLTQPPTGTITQ